MKKLLALSALVLLPSCGLFENVEAKDVTKTVKSVNEVSRQLCILFGESNPTELSGLSVDDFCKARENIERFMPLAFAAQSGSTMEAGCNAEPVSQ